MLSLKAWAEREGIAYSQAHKMFYTGRIAGAVLGGDLGDDHRPIRVPYTTKAPVRQKISCQVCGCKFSLLTSSHLKKHGMTQQEYRERYPDAPIMTAEVVQLYAEAKKKRRRKSR